MSVWPAEYVTSSRAGPGAAGPGYPTKTPTRKNVRFLSMMPEIPPDDWMSVELPANVPPSGPLNVLPPEQHDTLPAMLVNQSTCFLNGSNWMTVGFLPPPFALRPPTPAANTLACASIVTV